MKKVIKHPKKMKNVMYIVFGAFALALFVITRTWNSYATDGLMIDNALDSIVLYGEVEQLPEDEEVEEVQDEEAQEIEQNQEIEEDEDIAEPEETSDEEINEEEKTSEDLDETILERDNKGIDKTENKEENHGVGDENGDNEENKQEQKVEEEVVCKNKEGNVESSEEFWFKSPENKITEEVQPDIIESVEIYWTWEYEWVKVEVYAQTWAFPLWTILSIVPITWDDEMSDIQDVLEEQKNVEKTEKVIAFDITFLDPETEEELQPLMTWAVQVSFNYEENEELKAAEQDEEQEVKVYHLNDKNEEWEKVEEIKDVVVEEVIVNEEESEEENVLVVEAESFSVYTIVVQVSEWLDSQLTNFTWNDISIRDPNNPLSWFTIMDRNLWAKNVNSKWYFYFWWNNYWFSMNWNYENVSIVNWTTWTKEADSIQWNNSYLNSWFISNKFMKNSTDYWNDWLLHWWLWWWWNDKDSNNYWLDLHNEEERQWPCPDWYHIPSIWEWKKVIEYRYSSYSLKWISIAKSYPKANWTTMIALEWDWIATLLRNDLKIPYWSYCNYDSYSRNKLFCYWYSNHIHLQSSSYVQANYASNYWLYLWEKYYWGAYNYDIRTWVTSESDAYQIRCFKNAYDQPDIYKINFHLNWEVTEKNVIWWEKLTIPTLIPRDGYIIDWRYTDPNFTNEYDYSSIVTENIDLYAREIPFEFWLIYISDPDNPFSWFAIMDRNLWAKESWTWKNSYWYLYQWWNNYWFLGTWFLDESYKKLQWNDSYNNSGYFSTGFYWMGNSVWIDWNLHWWLRWWSWDAQTNNRWLDNINETVVDRKWPCPEWWHIPSIWEWWKVLEYRKMNQNGYSNSDISSYKQEGITNMYLYNKRYNIFLNDLKLPFGWYRLNGNYLYWQWDRVFYYRSSSPSWSNIKNLYTHQSAGFFIWSSADNRAHSIRCFKNDYNPVVHTVSFETFEGNEFASKSVLSGKQLRLTTNPTKNWYYFGWWYTDEDLTNLYDFSLPVNESFTLYAKWNSPIVVYFNTNWWSNYDNKYIEPWKLLELKSDPYKDGYFFKWWYTDEDLTNLYDFSLPVNESFTLYAKWDNNFWTISISDPENPLSWFTIMDRNLWAKEPWLWENSYWYSYQWWNNYWFLNSSNIETTPILAERDDKYENNWYYWTQFITTYYGPYDYWSGSYFHDWLWWWSWDNENNNRWLDNISETAVNRKWPCPEWWHIPSAWEWSKVLEYFNETYNKDNDTHNELSFDGLHLSNSTIYWSNFQKYFQIPFAGYLYQWSNYAGKSYWNWYYWSSSVYYSNSRSAYTFYLTNGSIYSWYMYNRTQWNSIRCFKNNYERQDNYTLLLDTNWWNSIDDMEIRENHKLTWLPTPTREYSIFKWWFLDEEFTKTYDFNQLISWNLKFFAKWSCISWYTLSEDLQSCEKISVKFRANWGTFWNSDIYTINSIEKLGMGNVTKVSHTSNIDDEGNSNGNYGDNLNTLWEVITISWAQNLKITIVHGTEPISWDWVSMWTWAHPDYTAKNNYSSSIVWTNWKLWWSRDTLQTNVYEVEWDTVTFSFASDGGTNYYWYYATISWIWEKYVTAYSWDVFDNIPEPTRDWYTFKWWYFDNETFSHEFNPSEVTTWESMNVYAKWQENTYTISFAADNWETNPENITVIYDSQYPGLPVVNKTWYTFSWWYNWEEMVSSWDIVKITEDVTLKAKRNINQYKIIFDTDGWNIINPIDVDYNSVIPNLQNPTKECNKFSWWNAELPERMPAYDIILKAIWEYTCSRSSWGGWAKKSESDTRKIAIDTSTEQEHNSAVEDKKSETSSNQETTQKVDDNSKKDVETETVVDNTATSNNSSYTLEQKQSYEFAKSNWITTTSSIEQAKMNTSLTRIEMAKMLSYYAINVLWQEPDAEKWVVKFSDVTNKLDKEYDNWVTLAYQLGIMWQNMPNNKFRPNDEVTRAEFATALSRLLYNTDEWEYKWTRKYYEPHIAKLYNEWIINNTDSKMKEKRWYVMIMLMRTAK